MNILKQVNPSRHYKTHGAVNSAVLYILQCDVEASKCASLWRCLRKQLKHIFMTPLQGASSIISNSPFVLHNNHVRVPDLTALHHIYTH